MAAVDVIWLFLVILALHGYVVRACYFGSSRDCIFRCNCADNASCDSQTGACPDGCRDGQPRPAGNVTRFDWRGPGCRIGNVALHKTINQSGVYGQWYANQSVDGKLPSTASEEHATCTATSWTRNAWWSVDLEAVYHIYRIIIFNRINKPSAARTANFNVRIGNSSDFSLNTFCLNYTGPVPTGGSAILTCTTPISGRFVSLQKTGGLQAIIINICEVVVMGYEAIRVACDAGRYGINCVSTCSDHHCKGGNMTCDHVTGECPSGCEDWYIGRNCDTHIQELEYNSFPSTNIIRATQIRVMWGPDNGITPNLAQYYGYQVQYKASNDSEFISGHNVSHVPDANEYSATISLIHNTWYTLRISIYRHDGVLYEVSSRPTPERMIKTQCVDPDQVTNLRLTPITRTWPSVLNVEWTSKSSGCDSISSIQIIYRSNMTDDWMIRVVANPTTSTSTTITDITDGVWEVKVLVVNNEQLSSVSETRSVAIFNAPGLCDTCTSLTLTLAVLLGVSAVVHFGVLIYCAWIKLHKKKNSSISTTSVQTDETDTGTSNYEGLVERTSPMPENAYDEIYMDERTA